MQKFDGVAEKLKRAEENIDNLDTEIATFFQKGDYPVLPKDDGELFLKAIEYHKNRFIPPRFSVLAGEIVHHLRSCFDHVAWHFSVGATPEHKWIDFPVLKERPANSDDRRRYKRKIELIQNAEALRLIERLQPYNAADPLDDALYIINDFDIVDKHRELVISFPTGTVFFPNEMRPIVENYQRAHPELNPLQVARHFQDHGILMPYISFRDFGRREVQPVIPGLVDLFNYTVDAVKQFAAL